MDTADFPQLGNRYLLRGEETWCQGWSEPNAGSDLAGIKSRAVREEANGGWLLSGQKTWTTRGAFCDRLFGLFRSDPDAERHHGLTYFLVDLRAEGVKFSRPFAAQMPVNTLYESAVRMSIGRIGSSIFNTGLMCCCGKIAPHMTRLTKAYD